MFSFHKSRGRDPGWLSWPTVTALGNRRALLLSPRQFERELAKERIRATRRSIAFCVLTAELLCLSEPAQADATPGSRSDKKARQALPVKHRVRTQARKLVDLLHHNLRTTDDKGILSATRYGVLLVDTPEMGGRAALDRLSGLIAAAGLNVRLSLQVHDPEGFGDSEIPETDSNSPEKRQRQHDHGDEDWVRKPVTMGSSLETAPAAILSEPISFSKSAAIDLASGAQPLVAPESKSHADVRDVDFVGDRFTPQSSWAAASIKRTIDVVGASVGLLLASPVLAAAMIAIKWTDGGPPLFCQTREGQHGRPFTIYKLRTMIVDAEKSQAELRAASHRDGPAFKISRDPRVTKIGHFLRASCLDELPQLINVIKGEMSLVGPRPLPWHESRACARWHRRRLDVRPGLTCSWQVDKSKAETFDDWMRMDLRYIDRLGLLQDLRLIARTVIVPVTGRGGE